MKISRKLTWVMLLGMTALFTQCKDSGEDVAPDDENELITTVILKFTEQGTTNVTTFKSSDPDGEGGNPPVVENITLKSGKTYAVETQILDESKTPAVDVTEEVQEKAEEHLFVYTTSPAALLAYTATDKDANNLPIGIKGQAVTGAAGTGTLKVQLRHQVGTKNGTATPGSDDVNVNFPLSVQ
ncbi:MAG TPA: hypothetical protein VGN64_23695 [Dyadobacter sp.]|jgi:hypothetical protein|nr:hypothetical protein [Dyadobacter sp.]